ncbi:hypothetical protein [Hadaka virus 1]|nr:hypothetical protein [Hadaka virus 1]
MATKLIRLTPSNIAEHPLVRDAVRVVKQEKVCVYRNGLLKGQMQGKWVVVPYHGVITMLGFEKPVSRLYCIKNPVKSETDSEVYFVPDVVDIPAETAQKDQSDYLILKVYV